METSRLSLPSRTLSTSTLATETSRIESTASSPPTLITTIPTPSGTTAATRTTTLPASQSQSSTVSSSSPLSGSGMILLIAVCSLLGFTLLLFGLLVWLRRRHLKRDLLGVELQSRSAPGSRFKSLFFSRGVYKKARKRNRSMSSAEREIGVDRNSFPEPSGYGSKPFSPNDIFVPSALNFNPDIFHVSSSLHFNPDIPPAPSSLDSNPENPTEGYSNVEYTELIGPETNALLGDSPIPPPKIPAATSGDETPSLLQSHPQPCESPLSIDACPDSLIPGFRMPRPTGGDGAAGHY